jgi:hypothetical protein
MPMSLKQNFLWFAFLFFCLYASAQTVVTSQISKGSDDAEQSLSSGNMSLGSSDLELTSDGGNNQLVGLRFEGISIP